MRATRCTGVNRLGTSVLEREYLVRLPWSLERSDRKAGHTKHHAEYRQDDE